MFLIIQHEVKYYFKNIKEAIYIYGFIISIILLAPFGLSTAEGSLQTLAPAIVWIALTTAATLGSMTLYQRDAEQGKLLYFQLLPISLEQLVLAKWAAFCLFLLAPLAALLPVAMLLLSIAPERWGYYAIGISFGIGTLGGIASLAGALMAGMERAGAILSLIVLPLTIPVMIFGTYYCAQAKNYGDSSLLFLVGFTIFLLPIMCLAGASSIRHAN